MKENKNSDVPGARSCDCGHLRGAHPELYAYQLRAHPISDFGSPLRAALLYAGGGSGALCGLSAVQPDGRTPRDGCGLRKPGHPDRRAGIPVSAAA